MIEDLPDFTFEVLKKRRGPQPQSHFCDYCKILCLSGTEYHRHIKLKGHKENMKRTIHESDDEGASNYESSKVHWMKRATTKWNKNKKNPDYLFEDLLDQDDIRTEKEFFDRLDDELRKELR